jgi:coenzyme F420-0:L-glutamate ligase/coenzyme F420-1:gamma-L-glutamate ligase
LSDLRVDARPLPGLPEIAPGSDLAQAIAEAAKSASLVLQHGDVLVVAQKVVSKAEGRLRELSAVEPGERARELAHRLDKDARMVQVVLDESAEVVRAERGVLVTRMRFGHVCANAGVDSSNVPGDAVALLPEDPDRSARNLREALERHTGVAPGVLISDSFGRPWRLGQSDVAIGCAGIVPLEDLRGTQDAVGRELTATLPAIADEMAAAASLARSKGGREAVVCLRGLERYVTREHGPGAAALIRPLEDDLFR